MHLWTKAVVLLIVTNTMASSYHNRASKKTINLRTESLVTCSESAKKEKIEIIECSGKKWGVKITLTPASRSANEAVKRICCWQLDLICVIPTFDKKNCEVKDGYDAVRQESKDNITKDCTANGVDPDKDCEPLILPMPESCPQLECDLNAKPPNVQPLPVLNLAKGIHISMCLIVVSFLMTFMFF